jgi:hypothetical protein
MLDPRAEVHQAAERIRNALTRLGLCYRTKNGDLVEICFRQLGLVGDQYGLLEVDVQRLPPRVSIGKLTDKGTLHHLTAVVGRGVKKLNTTGLTYCIELQPGTKQRLPHSIPLDVDTRPSGQFMIPIGQNTEGAEWRGLFDTSHILVGGESRSGKSTWLNAMLVALLSTYTSAELRVALVDPKGVEFTPFSGIPHLVKPIAITPNQASAVLNWLVTEMDARRELFAGVYARNLTAYNERAPKQGASPLPLILVVIDEVSDIALQCGLSSTFYRNLIRVSSKGGAFGLVLVLATQNPKAEVLNTLIRGNMSTRIAFRVSSVEHSRTILGRGGAQELPRTIRGRMLARLDESMVQLQGFHVSDEDVLALARRLSAQSRPRLSPIERELVVCAQEELAGAFPIQRLYQRFRGQVSYRQLVKLGRRWENVGWLTRPASVTEARQVTDELREIAVRSMKSRETELA